MRLPFDELFANTSTEVLSNEARVPCKPNSDRSGTTTLPERENRIADLRDFFAATALQGLLSRDAGRNITAIADYESKRAASAYKLADAMLKAR